MPMQKTRGRGGAATVTMMTTALGGPEGLLTPCRHRPPWAGRAAPPPLPRLGSTRPLLPLLYRLPPGAGSAPTATPLQPRSPFLAPEPRFPPKPPENSSLAQTILTTTRMVIEISGSIACCLFRQGTPAGPPGGRRPAVSAGGRRRRPPPSPPAPALMAQLHQSGQQQWRQGPGGGLRCNLYRLRHPPLRRQQYNVVLLDYPP